MVSRQPWLPPGPQYSSHSGALSASAAPRSSIQTKSDSRAYGGDRLPQPKELWTTLFEALVHSADGRRACSRSSKATRFAAPGLHRAHRSNGKVPICRSKERWPHSLVMKGSPVRVRASALRMSQQIEAVSVLHPTGAHAETRLVLGGFGCRWLYVGGTLTVAAGSVAHAEGRGARASSRRIGRAL